MNIVLFVLLQGVSDNSLLLLYTWIHFVPKVHWVLRKQKQNIFFRATLSWVKIYCIINIYLSLHTDRRSYIAFIIEHI